MILGSENGIRVAALAAYDNLNMRILNKFTQRDYDFIYRKENKNKLSIE